MIRSTPLRRLATLATITLGLALAGGPRAQAQGWGYGYGFGGYGGGFGGYGGGGWGGGWGEFGGGMPGGMTVYDAALLRDQTFMMNNARYNAMNAFSTQAFQSANLMEQQAYNTALQNQRLSMELAQEKYNVANQNRKSYELARDTNDPPAPIGQFVSANGEVLWPESAPSGGAHGTRRQAVDAAVSKAAGAFRSSGQVSVYDLVNARKALRAYGQPALDLLGNRRDIKGRAQLLAFLNGFDRSLDHLSTPPVDAAAAPADAPAPNANPNR